MSGQLQRNACGFRYVRTVGLAQSGSSIAYAVSCKFWPTPGCMRYIEGLLGAIAVLLLMIQAEY
jgi:hypothetical protein